MPKLRGKMHGPILRPTHKILVNLQFWDTNLAALFIDGIYHFQFPFSEHFVRYSSGTAAVIGIAVRAIAAACDFLTQRLAQLICPEMVYRAVIFERNRVYRRAFHGVQRSNNVLYRAVRFACDDRRIFFAVSRYFPGRQLQSVMA